MHLKEIKSSQLEKSKENCTSILDVIDNGKRIWEILRAQKHQYNFDKDQEIFSYLIDSKYLQNSQEVYDSREIYESSQTLTIKSPQFDRINSTKPIKYSFHQSKNLEIDSQSKEDLTCSKKTEDSENLKKNQLFNLREKEILSNKEILKPENLAKWKLWKELKVLLVCDNQKLSKKFKENTFINIQK